MATQKCKFLVCLFTPSRLQVYWLLLPKPRIDPLSSENPSSMPRTVLNPSVDRSSITYPWSIHSQRPPLSTCGFEGDIWIQAITQSDIFQNFISQTNHFWVGLDRQFAGHPVARLGRESSDSEKILACGYLAPGLGLSLGIMWPDLSFIMYKMRDLDKLISQVCHS